MPARHRGRTVVMQRPWASGTSQELGKQRGRSTEMPRTPQHHVLSITPHIRVAGSDPHSYIWRNRDHCRGIAFITAAARSGSTAPKSRTRMPLPISNSIAGTLFATAGDGGLIAGGAI